MFYRIVRNRNYLKHHGISGQKWGVRNGPPYPLNDNDSKRISNKLDLDLQFFAKKPYEYPTIQVSKTEYAIVMKEVFREVHLYKNTDKSLYIDIDGFIYTIDNTDIDNPRIIGITEKEDAYTGLYERNNNG